MNSQKAPHTSDESWDIFSDFFRWRHRKISRIHLVTLGDPLYGPLEQQGIHGLLEVLPAVSGPEADALMGERRSLMESDAHPGGPAEAQQTPPLWGKVRQASPHLAPSTPPGWGSCRSLLSLAALIWVGLMAGSPAGASTKGLFLCHVSLYSSSCQRTKMIKDGCPELVLPGKSLSWLSWSLWSSGQKSRMSLPFCQLAGWPWPCSVALWGLDPGRESLRMEPS